MREMEARAHLAGFMRGERIRWLAAAIQSNSILEKVTALTAAMPPMSVPDRSLTPQKHEAQSIKAPITPPQPGTIRIDAATFTKASGIQIHDCFTGGKQVYNPKYAPGWGTGANITWKVNIPSADTYELILLTAVANVEQTVNISINGSTPSPLSVINSHGLWQATRPLVITLKPGENTINLTRPATGRGLALRYLEIKKLLNHQQYAIPLAK